MRQWFARHGSPIRCTTSSQRHSDVAGEEQAPRPAGHRAEPPALDERVDALDGRAQVEGGLRAGQVRTYRRCGAVAVEALHGRNLLSGSPLRGAMDHYSVVHLGAGGVPARGRTSRERRGFPGFALVHGFSRPCPGTTRRAGSRRRPPARRPSSASVSSSRSAPHGALLAGAIGSRVQASPRPQGPRPSRRPRRGPSASHR